jgi:hypothetical protein
MRHTTRLHLTSLRAACAAFLLPGILTIQAAPAAQGAADPYAEAASNVRLVGYHDLQGRESLQVTTKSDAANGNWVYVGHSDNYARKGARHFNPLAKRDEWNGTSILEISDPAHPRLVWHIPNEISANSRSVSVVYDYRFNSNPPGRDYLIRSVHASDDSVMKFQVFDITPRDTDPSKIALVSEIRGTPENSCGPGCGGTFTRRAHKGWWSQETGLFYSAAGEPGFRQAILQIWDLKDPKNPKFLGRAWLPGQKDGDPEMTPEVGRWHHPIVDEENDRVYAGFRDSGDVAAFDVSDPAHPTLVWRVDTAPPGRGPHTVSPIRYDRVPNFGPKGLPRTYALVVDEASGEQDSAPCPDPVRPKVYMLDITHEQHPFPVSTWQVPVGSFCEKGGRFGPHQSAETVNGALNRFEDKIAWIAYFNAGVRVLDISDPYNLEEVGSYVPKITPNSHGQDASGGGDEGGPPHGPVIQINDVDVDHRGLAYVSDRVGGGLFVLEYTGRKKTSD